MEQRSTTKETAVTPNAANVRRDPLASHAGARLDDAFAADAASLADDAFAPNAASLADDAFAPNAASLADDAFAPNAASLAGDAGSPDAGSAEHDAHRLRNGMIWTSALGLLLIAIGLAVPDLRSVLDRVAHANAGWLALAIVLELGSCLGYVATVRLVLYRGPAREIRWLAWAEMAFGAVVPVGGAGGLAVGAWAMRAWGAAWSRIVNRSAVIFLLTTAINAAVLALAGLGVWLGVGSRRVGVVLGLVPAIVGIGGIGFFLVLPRITSRRLEPRVRRVATWVSDTEAVAFRPDWRLLGAVAYLLLDIAVLWACLRAVGTAPPLLAMVVGYQVGYLANLVPIPGAIGVLEGGLLGALLLYGLPAAPTAAAVVLYHAIALWVPSIGGTVGFTRLRRSVAALGATRGAGAPRGRLEAVRDDVAPAQAPAAGDLAA